MPTKKGRRRMPEPGEESMGRRWGPGENLKENSKEESTELNTKTSKTLEVKTQTLILKLVFFLTGLPLPWPNNWNLSKWKINV